MALRSTSEAWGAVTRWLHWLSAALIVFGLTHGYWMANFLPRAQRLTHYWLHSLVLVYFALLLLLIRIAWRLSEPTPHLPPESAAWEKAAAHLGHLALYLLTIAVLVTGYLNWSAFPARFDPARAQLMDIWLFGVYQLQGIHAQADRAAFQFWEYGHAYLSWALAGLVVVHVLAALRHQFIKRNNVMRRMWRGEP